MDYIKIRPFKETIKIYVFTVGYFFMLTISGALFVTIYNHFYPLDTSSQSILIVAILFTLVVVIDFGLLLFSKPSLALIAIVIVISPFLGLYKLIKNTDLIQIDRSTPMKLKKYLPSKFITG